MNAHSFLPTPTTTPIFEGGNEICKKVNRGANFKNICMGNQKGEGRRNVKVIGSCDFFVFIFSLVAMMVLNFAFRKSSLEDFFQKNI